MRPTSLAFALVCGLAGCGSGCHGERRQPIDPPHPTRPDDAAVAVAAADAGPGPGAPRDAAVALAPRYLDAPAGSFDALFTGLAAIERGDPHTAGDSMTSRLRITLQGKFGDAGRGLVAAGKPQSRYYYQRDVRYGASGKWKVAVGGHK